MFNQAEISIIGQDNVIYIIEGPNPTKCLDGYNHYLKGRKSRALRGRSIVHALGGDAA